jgi:hypothetical protein
MDAIREYSQKTWVVALIAFIIGLLIGWMFLGWVVAPVTWTDAAPQHLRAEVKEDYLRMAIDSFALTGDGATAKTRYDTLGEEGPTLLGQIQAAPGSVSPDAVARFTTAVGATAVLPGTTPAVTTPNVLTTPGAGTAEPERSGLSRMIIPILCVITFLLGLGLAAAFLLRGRMKAGQTQAAVDEANAARDALKTDYASEGEEPPIGQFMASYKLGDDLFDDSFSIDSPSGEFLGECGVGISESIGVGEPKKVTAFEVWLFDKNDIQTVTKVLMSTHAFNDEAVRQRLAAKGEPVEAAPGNQVVLETASLQLVARVVDMTYGEGALPESSFFESMILELAVWQK